MDAELYMLPDFPFFFFLPFTSAIHIFNAYLPGKLYEATVDYFVVLLIKPSHEQLVIIQWNLLKINPKT